MNEKSYIKWDNLNDVAIERQIGIFLKQTRQNQNKTQSEVAKAANISRSTLSLLENGESGNLMTLIQVLRVLDQLHVFQAFEYKEVVSPLQLARMQHGQKERVRRKKNPISKEEKMINW